MNIFFFFLSIIIYISRFYILIYYDNEIITTLMIGVIIFLIIFIIIIGKYTYKKIFMLSLLFLICALIYIKTQFMAPFLLLLFSICLKYVRLIDIVKIYFYTNIFYFLIIISLSLTEIIPNSVMVSYNGIKRYSLGFGNPNTLFIILFIILASFLYINFDKNNIITNIIIIIISYIFFYMTKSRTGFYSVCIMVLLIIFFKKCQFRKRNFLIKYLLKNIIIIVTLFSLFLAISFNNMDGFINQILSKRPYYWNIYINNDIYKIGMFGNNMLGNKMFEEFIKEFPLDNAYLYIICIQGIFSFIVYSIIYYFGIRSLIYYNMNKEILFIIIFLIYGIFENITFNIALNFTLLFILNGIDRFLNEKYILKTRSKNEYYKI